MVNEISRFLLLLYNLNGGFYGDKANFGNSLLQRSYRRLEGAGEKLTVLLDIIFQLDTELLQFIEAPLAEFEGFIDHFWVQRAVVFDTVQKIFAEFQEILALLFAGGVYGLGDFFDKIIHVHFQFLDKHVRAVGGIQKIDPAVNVVGHFLQRRYF